jgi:hypothetical protein
MKYFTKRRKKEMKGEKQRKERKIKNKMNE